MTSDDDKPPSPELLRLAAKAAVPAEGRAAVARRHTPPVSAGQLWRATWADSSVILLILGATRDVVGRPDVLACPVTAPISDEDAADDEALADLCTATMNDRGERVLLWHGLAVRLPYAVLDICLDDSNSQPSPTEWADPLSSADARHELLTRLDPFSPYVDELAQMLDDLETLESTPRLEATPPQQENASLTDALPGAGMDKIRTLIDVLGLSQPDAMAVLRRRRPLTDTELDRLAEHLPGVTLPDRAAGFPPRLVEALEHPKWRDAVRGRAHGGDELAARRQIAASVATMAARDSATEPNWDERIARWVQARP